MKRFLKIIVLTIAGLSVFLFALYFVYQRMTPRWLGPNQFPLKEVMNKCVGERVREVSSAPNGVFFVKTNNSLRAYRVDSGSPIWSSALNTDGETFPAVAIGDQVFVTDNDRFISFDVETGRLLGTVQLKGDNAWIPDASEEFVLLNTVSGPIELYDVVSGSKRWEISAGRGYTPAFINENKVYVIDHGIKALDASTGQLLWDVTNQRATGIGTFSDGILYYVEYPGEQTYDLVALNTKTHSELWRRNFIKSSPRESSVHNEFLFLTESNALYKINTHDGTIDWRKELSDPTNLSFIDGNVFVLEQFHRQIYILDLKTGEELATLKVSWPRVVGDRTQEMIAAGNHLVFSRGCEIFIYSR